jgi:hypothetical protein
VKDLDMNDIWTEDRDGNGQVRSCRIVHKISPSDLLKRAIAMIKITFVESEKRRNMMYLWVGTALGAIGGPFAVLGVGLYVFIIHHMKHLELWMLTQ